MKSLQRNEIHREYVNNDAEALTYAIKAGISQSFNPSKKNNSDDYWTNSGFGLFMVSEICKELRGSFCLASGNKYLYINNGDTSVGDTYFSGTAVQIKISTSELVKDGDVINIISKRGEEQAKLIRNAFQKASKPSKGLIDTL